MLLRVASKLRSHSALFFAVLAYKLGCNLIRKKSEDNETVSSETPIRQGEIALLSIGLVICTTLTLGMWVFREGISEIFPDWISHNAVNESASLNDNKDINIVLISIDSLRADHLSCYGYNRRTSSNIDRLASEGVMFSNAFSVTSWTLPAHTSILTSMYSESHGVITSTDYLDEKRITLAEVLKEEGYTTAAFVSGPLLNSLFGLNQGFDLYDDFTINYDISRVPHRALGSHKDPNVFSDPIPESVHTASHQALTSPKLNESIQDWLRENYQKRFFLFLHYWDVHFDYIPPPPYDTMFDPSYKGIIDARSFLNNPRIRPGMDPRDLFHIIALYDGEIAFTDKYIGELVSTLKELRIYDRTLIVVTADHGDEFFEHGGKGHNRTLYEELLHVPLIFKFPHNWKANTKIEEVSSIIDIAPTILGYLGVQPHQEMQGRNLLSSLNGSRKSSDFFVYSSYEYSLAAVRSASSKFIHHLNVSKEEFYDLVNDPKEKINLFDEGAVGDVSGGERHVTFLTNWLNTQRQIYQNLSKTDNKRKIELSEPIKEQLRSLGYIR